MPLTWDYYAAQKNAALNGGQDNMWQLAALGAAAQMGGSIYSTYSSIKRQKKAMKFAKKLAKNQIQWRVADAKKAGLHPLAALGISPASGPGIPSADTSGYSEAGASLNRALSSIPSKHEKLMDRLALQNARAELDRKNLVNIGLQQEIEEAERKKGDVDPQGVIVSGQSDSSPSGKIGYPPGVLFQDVVRNKMKSYGLEAGDTAGEQSYIVPTLEGPARIGAPSQPLSEPVESAWHTQLQYGLIKGLDMGKAFRSYMFPWSKEAKRVRNLLRKYRDTHLEKPRKGYSWQYDPLSGSWVQRKGPKKLFSRYSGTNTWKFGYE